MTELEALKASVAARRAELDELRPVRGAALAPFVGAAEPAGAAPHASPAAA